MVSGSVLRDTPARLALQLPAAVRSVSAVAAASLLFTTVVAALVGLVVGVVTALVVAVAVGRAD